MHTHAAKIFLSLHWYHIVVIAILLLSFSLRLFDLSDRFGLAYDQARDLLVAREALRTNVLPLIGPFASAGQFVYGPQWYWLLIAFVFLTPGWFLGPWVVLGVLYCFCVFLMMRVGLMIGGKVMSIIIGILIAVSPGGIAQSVNLSSPSMAGVLSIVSIFFFTRYVLRKKITDGFFLAFFISTTIMVHFQAVGLLSLLLAGWIFGKRGVRDSALMLAGFFLPLLPLMYFDVTNNFFESRNMLDYYLHGQERIYYPNRWFTYLGSFWPRAWARIVGGEPVLGYIGFFGFFILMLVSFYKKKMNKVVIGLSVVFFTNLVILRYYKGQLFDSYLVFLHGIILILTSLLIVSLYRWRKAAGISLLVFFVAGSLKGVHTDMKGSANGTLIRSAAVAVALQREYPTKSFSLYDYRYMSPQVSLPIVLYLDYKGKVNDSGVPIGVTSIADAASMSAYPIIDPMLDVAVVDLSTSTAAHLSKEGWGGVNPSDVFKSTVLWYKDKKI